jgi:hypothetical protein
VGGLTSIMSTASADRVAESKPSWTIESALGKST